MIGNKLVLGQLAGTNTSLGILRDERDKHLYVCGGTGTGKSKFLEGLIRQDIKNWHKSKCGMLLLDPHGSLFDEVINWLAWNQDILNVPIVPIDLRKDDWVVSYNMLRQRETADPSVLIDNIVDAMAYVWGEDGTDRTPLFARWAGNILRALYEKKLTLIEAEHLIDRVRKDIRRAMTSDLKDVPAQQDWMFFDTLNPKDSEAQVGSTINRLLRFIRNQMMRSIFGLPNVSLDLRKALDDGAIILVSLATEHAKVSKENAALFGTVLLNDLWTAALERGKRDDVKPFYVYLDEFQKFITPTIAENLDEARGYGLHLTLAQQFPAQILDRGEHGKRVYRSIMETASSKVVFRLQHEENLRDLAQWMFMGSMNPDEVKHELYGTKVLAYREELRTGISRSKSSSAGGGAFTGTTESHATSGLMIDNEHSDPTAWGASLAESDGDSQTWTESESMTETESSVLIPIMGRELSHVQFRSIDEQKHRAMAALFDQKQRQCVARIVGMNTPVSIMTPEIYRAPFNAERRQRFLDRIYEGLPFALRADEARKQLEEWSKKVQEDLFQKWSLEPTTIKRKTGRPLA